MAGLIVSCQDTTSSSGTDGITHWLRCDEAGDCRQGAECVCGTCAPVCESNAECSSLHPNARCEASSDLVTRYSCDDSDAESVCSIPCSAPADCGSALEWRCIGMPNGYCERLANSSEAEPETGTGGGAGSAGAGNAGAASSLPESGAGGNASSSVDQSGGAGDIGGGRPGTGGATATGGSSGSSGGGTPNGNGGTNTGGTIDGVGGGAIAGTAGDNGEAVGGSGASGGAASGGTDTGGTGGATTGGSSGFGGQAGTGAAMGSGGSAGGGTAGYLPCDGKRCGEPCSPCDPNDPECRVAPVLMSCDATGTCAIGEPQACPVELWSETDAVQYAVGEMGTTTLHNDSDATVYLQGCGSYFYEQQVAGSWVDRGPELVLCDTEGNARPVLAGETIAAEFGPFDASDGGTWRIRHTVGHACSEALPMNEENCTSLEDVFSPSFTVEMESACGDPVLMAAYAECSAAQDEATCASLGGTWQLFGLGDTPICFCPTGDGDCGCTQASDCVAACLAETGPGGISDCSGVTEGKCAAGPTAGCWCWLEDGGTVNSICMD